LLKCTNKKIINTGITVEIFTIFALSDAMTKGLSVSPTYFTHYH
jgi:hypothetical protein